MGSGDVRDGTVVGTTGRHQTELRPGIVNDKDDNLGTGRKSRKFWSTYFIGESQERDEEHEEGRFTKSFIRNEHLLNYLLRSRSRILSYKPNKFL